MVRKLKKKIPQFLINISVHLPKAVLANVKYGFPSKKIKIIGVTGTDGKTTTVNMIYQILKSSGHRVAILSTINAMVDGKIYDTGFHVTTPDPNMIHNFLQQAVQASVEYMVLEVTSHALDQYRVWGIKFDIGVITNVTHEHLDYHKTFDNYLKSKKKLLENSNVAIINKDDPSFNKLRSGLLGRIVSFGMDKNSDINPKNFPVRLKIPGRYNIYNALAAASVGITLGIDKTSIRETLEKFEPLPGRMEYVKNSLGINLIVDFAHTPNALEEALKALKYQKKNHLISVFGCASERDTAKRPQMGQISAQLADITILTDEDPRFESSEKIIHEIADGAYQAGAVLNKNLFFEPDRKKAIELALRMAKRGDTIAVFGKGHEQSMNYKGVEKPWSDQQAITEALKKHI